MNPQKPHRLIAVIMDGVGVSKSEFGNAVRLAKTPNLDFLKSKTLYTTIFAHGTHVGLPSDDDIGNSEVGHNALGAGQIFDQGAKLVAKAVSTGAIFNSTVWNDLKSRLNGSDQTLHLIGLLSDGNVHSHEDHLYALMRAAYRDGIAKIRVHVLLDGRDVSEKSAEIYCERLMNVVHELQEKGSDVAVASGGGRMKVTMDRYEADWSIVERGWQAHVLGEAELKFSNLPEAIAHFRADSKLTDQYLPAFVMTDEKGKPVGTINDGDGVILFNFRGDRAIEICRAFSEPQFNKFDRVRFPDVYFAGMMEYDGDFHIPKNFLVEPPLITNTLGTYLVEKEVRQFACSETQKFGHVTYFWNGNRSGKISDQYEDFAEIPSDRIEFDQKPEMKAREVADQIIKHIPDFDFLRANFANGDMVGHTGNLEAAIVAVETVDRQIGRLIEACKKSATRLIVTADHGNCDEMLEGNESDFPNWRDLPKERRPPPKTSHSKNPVPFYYFDPQESDEFILNEGVKAGSLGNFANTALLVMGIPLNQKFLPPLFAKRHV